MMSLEDVLLLLSQKLLKNYGSRVGVPSSGKKADVARRVIDAAGAARRPSEQGIGDLIERMTGEELSYALCFNGWAGESVEYEVLHAVGRLPVATRKRLLLELALAGEGEPLDVVAKSPRWSDMFVEIMFDEDESGEEGDEDGEEAVDDDEAGDDESDVDEADEDGVDETVDPWRDQNTVLVHPRMNPPTGFSFVQRPLFTHQTDALSALGRWYGGATPAGVLCLPTGGGKTRTAAQFVLDKVLSSGGKVLWLAHRQELLG